MNFRFAKTLSFLALAQTTPSVPSLSFLGSPIQERCTSRGLARRGRRVTVDDLWKSQPYPLEALQRKLLEARDPQEKQRIQRLIAAETDLLAIEQFVKTLKTREAGDIISNASLLFLVKHVFNVRAEFDPPKK